MEIQNSRHIWTKILNIDDSENYPLHQAARKYTILLMEYNCCLYSQHIKGVHNNVANALSRLHHLSPDE